MRCNRPDGRYGQCRGQPMTVVRDTRVAPAGTTDIAGKRRRFVSLLHSLDAEDRLRQAEAFCQGTLDSLAAHIAILDEYGTIIAVNAAWRRFGASEGGDSDCVGSNYIAVCEAADDPLATAVARGLGEILAGDRQELQLDYPCHSPSEQRWFLFRATRFAGSGPLRVVVLHADMTERHRIQEQAFLQAALLDQIDVSVILTDLDLTVLSWNAGAERLYGWSAKEAIGRPASETILPPESVRRAEEGGETSALQSDGRWDGDYIVRRKDGSTFPAHVRSRLISDQDGHVTGAANVAMDITARGGIRARVGQRPQLSARGDRRRGRGLVHHRFSWLRELHEPGRDGPARLGMGRAPGTRTASDPACPEVGRVAHADRGVPDAPRSSRWQAGPGRGRHVHLPRWQSSAGCLHRVAVCDRGWRRRLRRPVRGHHRAPSRRAPRRTRPRETRMARAHPGSAHRGTLRPLQPADRRPADR